CWATSPAPRPCARPWRPPTACWRRSWTSSSASTPTASSPWRRNCAPSGTRCRPHRRSPRPPP
ncbi:MAG: hypothetical protein AVDCRST_MAG54-1016, partial [uncultured Actinomycetospora sp.]